MLPSDANLIMSGDDEKEWATEEERVIAFISAQAVKDIEEADNMIDVDINEVNEFGVDIDEENEFGVNSFMTSCIGNQDRRRRRGSAVRCLKFQVGQDQEGL